MPSSEQLRRLENLRLMLGIVPGAIHGPSHEVQPLDEQLLLIMEQLVKEFVQRGS